ncbi:MAG TPA: hypothetical protein VK819_06605 [Acidobacteriaceae bacterium]|jgi:hypothetical protein|nr:hypothetical protein [Acidobacteriaceae bacterium]
MLTKTLMVSQPGAAWRKELSRWAVLALYLLMTVQFVGCYLFLGRSYIDLDRFGHGYERLPFQTRLLLAPLFRWAQSSPHMIHYASQLAMNGYFFPHGVGPGGVVQLYLDIPCVLIAGWVAVRLYQASSRQHLLTWLVYPLFLVLCTVSYILHAVQNYRFIYDMPSMAFFGLGLYLIYFRKSVIWLVALFAVATWNRETTLFLIPFFLLSACVRERHPTLAELSAEKAQGGHSGQGSLLPMHVSPGSEWFEWRRALRPEVAVPALLMLVYWTAWHVFIFHLFRHNSSEYFPRIGFNWQCIRRLRYYPQLLSAFGYLLPFLVIYRKQVHDAQLRIWMFAIPAWYAVMAVWGILVETRVFGELLPFVACAAMLVAEEAVVAAIQKRGLSQNEGDRARLFRAA